MEWKTNKGSHKARHGKTPSRVETEDRGDTAQERVRGGIRCGPVLPRAGSKRLILSYLPRVGAGTPAYRQLLGPGGGRSPRSVPAEAGLAGARCAPSAQGGQASSSSEKPVRNRAGADHGTRRAPEPTRLGRRRLLFFPRCRPARRARGDSIPPGASQEPLREDGGPARKAPARASERGRCRAQGRSEDLRRESLGSGSRSGAGREWGTHGRRARGRRAGPAAVAASWAAVTRGRARCLAGPPAGSLRPGPWPPRAGSPAGSRGCPG